MTTTFTGFIGGSYSDSQVDNRIGLLLENAPDTLDTLGELAAALQANDGELANLLAVNNTQNTQIAALQGQAHNPLTLGTNAFGLTLAGQTLQLDLATITSGGAMSSTDKQKVNKVPADTVSEISALQTSSHDAVTLASGSNPALALNGQELTLTLPTLVESVNGEIGTVTLGTDNISEGSTNLYYTNSRVSSNSNVLANTSSRHDPLTLGPNTNGLGLVGQELSLELATGTTPGALSGVDFSRLSALGTRVDVGPGNTVDISTLNIPALTTVEVGLGVNASVTIASPNSIFVWSNIAGNFQSLGAGNAFTQGDVVGDLYEVVRIGNNYGFRRKTRGDLFYLVRTLGNVTTNFNTTTPQIVPFVSEQVDSSFCNAIQGIITFTKFCVVTVDTVVTLTETNNSNANRVVLNGQFYYNGATTVLDEGNQIYVRQQNGSNQGTFRNKLGNLMSPGDTLDFRVARAPGSISTPCFLSGRPRIFINIQEA